MKNNIEYDSDEFIAQWLADELDAEKQSEFKNWLNANPKEKEYFDNLQKVWQKSGRMKTAAGLSETERWERLSGRLSLGRESHQQPKGKQILWRAVSVAAMLILMISASYYWIVVRGTVTIYVPAGKHEIVTLPSGSQVTLNAESSLEYNKIQWDNHRHVILTGEAFFEVKSGSPFTIQSGHATTRVLGTSFNVKYRQDKVEVACVTGKVQVNLKDASENGVILTPGLASVVQQDSLPTQPGAFNQQQITGWMSHQFSFESTPLREILAEVERQYNVSVSLKKNIGDRLVTVSFDGADVAKALDIICLTTGLKYSRLQTGTIILR